MKEQMKIPFVLGTTALIAFCFVSASLLTIVVVISEAVGNPLNEYVQQMLSQIAMFLIPGLVFAYFFYDRFWDGLKLKNIGKRADYGLFVLLAVVIIPLNSYLQVINEAMTFPESMSAIEQFLRKMEQDAQDAVLRMVSGTSPMDLALMLLNMAVLPAVCEEVFFRGVVLNNLIKRTSKLHLSVWLLCLAMRR